jgi:hypothetical protein
MTFDFLESNSPDFYEISFRVVRLKAGSGNTETLITNLGPGRFPPRRPQGPLRQAPGH